MYKLEKFREVLYSLCSGDYTRDHVNYIVNVFCTEVECIIRYKESFFWNIGGQWEKRVGELRDIALDFVAPLFARDETGCFVELKRYFEPYFDLPEKDFQEALSRLLNSTVQQESIRIFQQRDPVGRMFYRSLRYILNKHGSWQKGFHPKYGPLVEDEHCNGSVATEEEIEQTLRTMSKGVFSVTQIVGKGFHTLVDVRQLRVLIQSMLRYTRQLVNHGKNASLDTKIEVDQTLRLSIDQIKNATVNYIDDQILIRYERSKKLTPEERNGFRRAIEVMLTDFSNGGMDMTYFDYLIMCLPSVSSKEEYQKKYRKQFEYVAKVAKNSFSASVKNDFNIK